jgi:type I restriction enzyme S subunit
VAENETQGAWTLPDSWVWTTLEHCVDILDSQRVPVNASERDARITGKHSSELYPYYGATGQVGWIDDYLFDEELVLLGEDGAPFLQALKDKAYIIRGKSWVNNHAHVLRAIAELMENSFLCHYLNTADYHDYVTGTTRLKLNQSRMRKVPVPLVPLPEQRRIVAEIETQFTRLDAGVAALERAQANLKRYRTSVLKAACEGCLVPTEAELARAEGRDYEPAGQLLACILAERQAKWEAENPGKKYKEAALPDTEDLPELPAGWVWTNLEQLSWHSRYGTSQKCTYDVPGPPVLRIPNISNGNFDLTDMKFGTKPSELQRIDPLAPNDLLIIRTNGSRDLIGRSALVRKAFGQLTYFASYLIRFRLVDTGNVPAWVAAIWDAPIMREWLERVAATSAGQYNISIGSLNQLPIPLPPLAEQRRIVADVERRLSVVAALEREVEAALARARRLRQAVLKRAFKGRLVPQDPGDEPASALLECIRAERARREGEGEASRRGGRRKKLPKQLELF